MTRPSDNQEAVGRFVQNEVSANVSGIVSTLAAGCDKVQDTQAGRELAALCEQAFELACPLPDYESAAIEEGWNCGPGVGGEQVIWHNSRRNVNDAMFPVTPGKPTYSTWEECCDGEDIESYDREVYEHWIISQYLANKLDAHGEKVDRDFAGLIIWARTTTGQAVLLDRVICDIFDELHAEDVEPAVDEAEADRLLAIGYTRSAAVYEVKSRRNDGSDVKP